jgi:hypothetical protein
VRVHIARHHHDLNRNVRFAHGNNLWEMVEGERLRKRRSIPSRIARHFEFRDHIARG